MTRVGALLSIALLGCPACAKDIAIRGPTADSGSADATVQDSLPTTTSDGAADAALDAGGGGGDGDPVRLDTGVEPCVGRPFCAAYALTTATVDQVVTVSPVVTPAGAAMAFAAAATAVELVRAPDRPALDPMEVDYLFEVDATSGDVTFRMLEVPPWFWTTTFVLPIEITGSASVEQAVAKVTVIGNTLIATGAGGDGIRAVASNGAPARGVRSTYPNAEVLDGQTASAPRAMLVSRDGSLLVHGTSGTTPRIYRVRVSSQNDVIDQFDAMFRPSGTPAYSIAELPDGAVAAPDYNFSATPSSRLLIFNADGSHRRTFNATNADAIWRGVSAGPGGELLIADAHTRAIVVMDPRTGALSAPLVDNLQGQPNAVLTLSDGTVFVAGTGFALRRLPSGERAAVMDLPGSASTHWRPMTAYTPGKILIGRDRRDTRTNVAVVTGRRFTGWLRGDNVGGPSLQPWGLAFLD